MAVEFKTWDKQFIAGAWRTGRSERQYTNRNPFDESELVTIRLASKEDVEEAYRSAATAQVEWWDLNRYTRSAIMMKAADIVEKQREDLIEILTIETGSSHLKAETEVDMFIGDIRYYAAIPMNMTGEIRPSVIPGKENRVYRLPVGVVGVISPFKGNVVERIKSITGGGVDHAVEASGRPENTRNAIDSLQLLGVAVQVGGSKLGTEATVDLNTILFERTLSGFLMGRSVPQLYIPALIELYKKGRFPFDRLIKYYAFDEINQAFEDSAKGITIKPIITFE
ncbi:aldehyde dehydrogenase family protein [Cohnella kolymensis]|uniref:aldehyde dehydrogenase family protein n=1 Tax=Cohnella kolymensis TaxID=1590652 RepID=UPI0006966F65|nr:aldehyde dehydrogenase family protein [Cohnella kolymensis]